MGILSKIGFFGVVFIGPIPLFLGMVIPMVLSDFDTNFSIVRYWNFDFWTFLLTFWKKHYFWNLIGPPPTNLDMGMPMVFLDFEDMLFLESWLFGLTFWGWLFSFFGFIMIVEHGSRIPEWSGTCHLDT